MPLTHGDPPLSLSLSCKCLAAMSQVGPKEAGVANIRFLIIGWHFLSLF
jgi:hypothetical protein